MNQGNQERQRMFEQGDISYIQPVKQAEDPTIEIIRQQFGSEVIPLKPEDMTWYQYYGLLHSYYKIGNQKHYWDSDVQSNEIIRILYENKFPKMWLEKYHQAIDQNGADFAASMGNSKILKWLEEEGIHPSEQGVIRALEKGFVNAIPKDEIYRILDESFDNGDIVTLKRLMIYPVLHYLEIPGNNDIEVRNNFLKDENTLGIVDNIASRGHLDILERLELLNILPSVSGANSAAKEGHIDTLEWLERRDILPDVNGANSVARKGYIDILNWLELHGILPDTYGASCALLQENEEVLDWLEKRKILPTSFSIRQIFKDGKVNIIPWLEKHNLLPNITLAYANGNIITLEWMKEKGLLQNVPIKNKIISLGNLARKGNLVALQWLNANNILSDVSTANMAKKYNQPKVLQWLAESGIYPTI
jgi:hypothetical protein